MGHASTASGRISRYILLSDIVGSSRLHEEYPREYAAVLDRHNTLVEQTVADCGGEIFKNTGDGYYAFFESASECIDCAAKLAAEFAKFQAFRTSIKGRAGSRENLCQLVFKEGMCYRK